MAVVLGPNLAGQVTTHEGERCGQQWALAGTYGLEAPLVPLVRLKAESPECRMSLRWSLLDPELGLGLRISFRLDSFCEVSSGTWSWWPRLC